MVYFQQIVTSELENHIGDVIARARKLKGINLETLAEAIGVDTRVLDEIEQTGNLDKLDRQIFKLTSLLGLNESKFIKILNGWKPLPIDISPWRYLWVIKCEDEFRTNVYIICDEASKECAIIDCGFSGEEVISLIEKEKLLPKYLLLTHDHIGHAGGVFKLKEKFPSLKVRSSSNRFPLHERNRETDFLIVGRLRVLLRFVPVHSPDSTIYIVGNWPDQAPYVAFVGDSLLACSIGNIKSDSSFNCLQIIQEKILTLPMDTLLCPGHGPLTTIEQERYVNPFFDF